MKVLPAGNGSLSPAGAYQTGGNGSGAGLGSQGAVIVSDDQRPGLRSPARRRVSRVWRPSREVEPDGLRDYGTTFGRLALARSAN
jgi:hypothetical protein